MKKVETLVLLSVNLSKLVHETQKERGMTTGYLASKGKKFQDQLLKQKDSTNKKFITIKNSIGKVDFKSYPKIFQENMDEILTALKNLKNIRQKVQTLKITNSNAFKYYTNINSIILNNIKHIAKLANDPIITRDIIAYANFLLSKERSGMERAVITNTLVVDRLSKETETRIASLITAQKIYINNFLDLANENSIKFYKQTLVGEAIDEVNRIRLSLENASKKHLIILQMKALVGYGGIIHNFKNYVIRGDIKYKTNSLKKYEEFPILIEQYKQISQISNKEEKLFIDIKNTFHNYFNGLKVITRLKDTKLKIEEIDKLVKVNDTSAIIALNTLSNSLFLDTSEYWFSQITVKINKLKKIDDELSKILLEETKLVKDHVYKGLLYSIIGSILSILLALLFGYIISKKITTTLEDFTKGLDGFFAFLNYKNHDVKLLTNTGSDEFGKMADKVNQNITMTKLGIQADRKVVQDTNLVLAQFAQGDLSQRVTKTSFNPSLQELTKLLNQMGNSMGNNIGNILDILEEYSNFNYTNRVESHGIKDHLLKLANGINFLGDSVTKMLKEITDEKDYSNIVIESNTNAIIAVGMDLKVKTFNYSAEKIFGYSKDEMIGKNSLLKLIPLNHIHQHNKGINDYFATGMFKHDNENLELIAIRKNGETFPIRISFGKNENLDKKERIVVANIQDISGEKEKEKKIKESTILLEQYKTAIDLTLIVSKTDIKGNITYINNQFCKISQYSQEELLGQPHNIVRHKNMPKKAFADMWKTIKSKKIWTGQVENRAKDGSSYYVNTMVMPILNSKDEIIEYISVRTDITALVKIEQDIMSTQKEVLFTLGELGEMRSKETGQHVSRVALYSELIATKYGLEKEEVALLKMASPMHDIGKVAIPDEILLKPGKLSDEEMGIMKTHAKIGHEIFCKSTHKMLQTAAIISHEHHEKYDGTGYPRGLKGEDINILGRITSVADVFDALSHDRAYKKAWTIQETLDFMIKEKNRSFDPRLVDVLINNIDEILKIKNEYNS